MAEPYNQNVFGQLVKERLEEMGWRQSDLADALGVRQQTVSKWVNGEPPKPSNARRIAETLQLDANVLMQVLLVGEAPVAPADAEVTLSGAARSGLDVADLTPDERAQVQGYIDALRQRRRTRGAS